MLKTDGFVGSKLLLYFIYVSYDSEQKDGKGWGTRDLNKQIQATP